MMALRVCTGCSCALSPDSYWRAGHSPDGLQSRCKACLRSQRRQPGQRKRDNYHKRQWYKRNKEQEKAFRARWLAINPEKRRAHKDVHNAVKRGDLVASPECQECGRQTALDAHHEDHSKPLEVRWLCRACHGLETQREWAERSRA